MSEREEAKALEIAKEILGCDDWHYANNKALRDTVDRATVPIAAALEAAQLCHECNAEPATRCAKCFHAVEDERDALRRGHEQIRDIDLEHIDGFSAARMAKNFSAAPHPARAGGKA